MEKEIKKICLNSKKIQFINIARGIAILLVLIGHGLTDCFVQNGMWQSSIAEFSFQFIYSFHMPLFFLISGFCGYKAIQLEEGTERRIYAKKRFVRLMVPYFFWGGMYVFFDIVGGNYTWKEFHLITYIYNLLKGDNANWQLWTLYTLFVCAILVLAFGKICSAEVLTVIAFVVYSIRIIINQIDGLPAWGFYTIFSKTTEMFFFYCIGILIRNKEKVICKITSKYLMIIAGVLLIAANIIIYMRKTPWLSGVTGVSGIFFIFCISYYMENKAASIVFKICGDYCMPIYILANLVQVLLRRILRYRMEVNGWVCLVISVICAATIPVLCDKYIIRKIPFVRKTLFGSST